MWVCSLMDQLCPFSSSIAVLLECACLSSLIKLFQHGTLVVAKLEPDYVTCTLPSCKQIAGGHPPQRALLQKRAGNTPAADSQSRKKTNTNRAKRRSQRGTGSVATRHWRQSAASVLDGMLAVLCGFLQVLCGREISRCIFHVHVQAAASEKTKKTKKEVFIETRRRTDGCMQKIDSLVLQSAVRPQVATTYRSVPIKGALYHHPYWGAT